MSDRDQNPAVAADPADRDSWSEEPIRAAKAAPPAPPSEAPTTVPAWRAAALALAAILILVGASVASAPFWAPLLPWGPAAERNEAAALAARLDGLEAAHAKMRQQLDQRPQRQEQDRLRQQMQQAAADAKTALQRIEQRIEAAETKPAAPAGDTAELRRQLAELSQSLAELTARFDTVEKTVQERGTRATAQAGLLLALLQLREAVHIGRPFAAEYQAFATLARGQAELADAAAPLAEPAKTGIASPAVLAKRLRELGGTIAAARARALPAEPGGAGWADGALARLRGLVTIRRLDGARPEGAEGAVNAAALALAGSDLAGAVAALDKLSGPAAEAAAPWLRMARQRLLVDAALRRVEVLLTGGLGIGAAAPGSAG